MPSSPGIKTVSLRPETYKLLQEYKYDVRVDSFSEAIEDAIRKAKGQIPEADTKLVKTNDILVAFHHARGDADKTDFLIRTYLTPIDNPPKIPGCVWYGKFTPARGKPVYICNDRDTIIAQTEEDFFGE